MRDSSRRRLEACSRRRLSEERGVVTGQENHSELLTPPMPDAEPLPLAKADRAVNNHRPSVDPPHQIGTRGRLRELQRQPRRVVSLVRRNAQRLPEPWMRRDPTLREQTVRPIARDEPFGA